MHRSSKDEFLQTRRILDELIDRHGRIAAPRAWLANWYILRVTRGWSEDRKREAAEALRATRAALDRDPLDALALATEGFVYCHLLKDLDTARKRCDQAVNANPSHALGWLYRGTVNAFKGEGDAAVKATRRALELSPLDPQRYYFESLGATAELAANQYASAERLARSSLVLNRMHPSTWRALTIALVCQGRMDEAREALRQSAAARAGTDCGKISSTLAEWRSGDRPALGVLPGDGWVAIGKRQFEPALNVETFFARIWSEHTRPSAAQEREFRRKA